MPGKGKRYFPFPWGDGSFLEQANTKEEQEVNYQ